MQPNAVPWKSILTSLPFWAILAAHMGQNYGYETLLTQLPTFMKQILHVNIKDVSHRKVDRHGVWQRHED